ncbi:MAG: murein biosynthesis integral membrane protein MurJ [Elusimicrobiota bacterium]
MLKNFRSFFAATLISRILGYVRDLAIAYFVGGGYWADIYFASFRITNLFRRLVGEGGLYAAYTPVYSSILAKDKDSAKAFAHAYAGKLILVLVPLIAAGMILAGPLTAALLPGFHGDPERILWAERLTRILLPFLLFVTLAAWAQATLQAHGRFFISSLSPALASAAIILYLATQGDPGARHDRMPAIITGLAWATLAGGILQYACLIPQLAATIGNFTRKNLSGSHPELKKSLKLLGPYMFIFALDQVNSFLDTFFGSWAQEGAITALYNSNRLIQLPLGLIGVGALATTLPEFAKNVAAKESHKIRAPMYKGIKMIALLQVPAALAYIFLGAAIVRLLYNHGRFDLAASNLTAEVLACAAPSLVFYSLQKIFISIFYAHQDVKSIVKVSALQLAVNSVGCALLVTSHGAQGIAMMSSISSFLGLSLLAYTATKKKYY